VSDAEFISRPLRTDDEVGSFGSRKPALDDWLQCSALHAEAIRSRRTWVWIRGGSIAAYFTLAGHVLEREALPKSIGRGSPDRIPAVLIARLALSEGLHGRGLGGVLLADASSRIVAATDIVAARFVVVDAIDDNAASFYEHFGYRPIPGTNRLIRKISDIARDQGEQRA
jgi:GNAT superfamily N-acetyltransferase